MNFLSGFLSDDQDSNDQDFDCQNFDDQDFEAWLKTGLHFCGTQVG